MRVAITGGTGFVGRNVARRLVDGGHEVVLLARGIDSGDGALPSGPLVTVAAASVTDRAALERAFAGCEAVVHCAGINREIGDQTCEAIHVTGRGTSSQRPRRRASSASR